jgi:signal transduction histidine kinase
MRERANLIGASLHIDSTPDKGTVVSIHVPLDHEPPL